MRELRIVVPGVPDTRCRPNAKCSERTRIRYRKKFAEDAVMPLRAARIEREQSFPISGLVTVDLLFRWPRGRKTHDRDALITMSKYLVDHLEREGIIENDRDVEYGSIDQEATTGQPEVVLTIRRAA